MIFSTGLTRRRSSWIYLGLCAWLQLACEAQSDPLPEALERVDGGQQPADASIATDPPHLSLNSVWGAAADDVWAVGAEGSMLHFDGERWQLLDRLTTANLTSVHGSKADDVWAVGEDTVLHWDGQQWSIALSDISETLLSVWQRGKDDVWMVGMAWDIGGGLIRHWDGAQWSWTALNGVSTLWEVWNSPDNTLWIGGTSQAGSGFLAQAHDRELARASYGGGSLRGIWGSAGDDVWVAPYAGALQHWDGSQWNEHHVDVDETRLLSVSGSSSDDVWAVGLKGLVLHWDGQDWTEVQSNTDATLWSVWSSGPDDAWVVGGDILHWDGNNWQQIERSHQQRQSAVDLTHTPPLKAQAAR